MLKLPQLPAQSPVQYSLADNAKEEFDAHATDYKVAESQFAEEHANIKPWASGNSISAGGLLHWAKETRRAAVQHYNELNSVKIMGGINKDVYLGASNKDDPDVYVKDGNGLLEVKTNDTGDSAPVDNLIFNAFKQLVSRATPATSSYAVHLYLENQDNVWPYTPSENNKSFNSADIKTRMHSRGIHISGDQRPVTIKIFYKKHGWKTVLYRFDGS